ncbi:MAG: cyclophilin-like family protein, partial [Candidatus Bathyarchaeia archaeon]
MEQSTSKIAARIIVHGKGEASVELIRHLSPITVNALVMNMPIYGRVNRLNESVVCVISQITAGVEKSRLTFSRGDVAFLPLNGSICIFLKEGRSARPMNPVGRVSSGLEV